jgi:integrase
MGKPSKAKSSSRVKPYWVGPLDKYPTGTWYCDYGDPNGVKKRQRFGKGGREEAREAHYKFGKSVKRKTHTARSALTFGDLLDAFEKRLEDRHRNWVGAGKPSAKSKEWLAGSTLRVYRFNIKNHLRPRLGPIRLSEMNTRDHLQPLITDIARKFKTVHEKLASLIEDALDHAVEQEWLEVSPHSLRPMSVAPVPEPITSIPEIHEGREIWLRLQEPSPRQDWQGGGRYVLARVNRIAMAALAMFGGVERGMTTALHWEDIDWIRGVINLCRSWNDVDKDKGGKTKHRHRTIPMCEEIRASLGAVWEANGRPASGYVFYTKPSKGGTRLGVNITVGRCLEVAQHRAGFVIDDGKMRWGGIGKPKWSYHEMRHYAGSVWLEAARRDHGQCTMGDLEEVAQLLGHVDTKMCRKVYIHYFKDTQLERHRRMVDAASALHRLPRPALPAPMRDIGEIPDQDIDIVE